MEYLSSWFLWSVFESYYVLSGTIFQFRRRNRIYKEEQRQLRAASRKGKDGEEGVDKHHH